MVETNTYQSEVQVKVTAAWRGLVGCPQPDAPARYGNRGIDRLVRAMDTKSPIQLLVPFGVRTFGDYGKERDILSLIADKQQELGQNGVPASVTIMPVDTSSFYGSLVPILAPTYINELATEVKEKYGFVIKPWSAIRDENIGQYESYKGQLAYWVIQDLVDRKTIDETIERTMERGRYMSLHLAYGDTVRELREQIVRADIIETQYRPILLDVSSPSTRQQPYDRTPRVYVAPPDKRNPWMG